MDEQDIKVKFKGLELLSKTLIQRPMEDFSGTSFHFDIKADAKINSQLKLILIFIDLKIRELDKEQILGSISVGCGFEVENFEDVIVKKNDLYDIPKGVDAFVKSISISTARGVMFSEFRGTYLSNALLPIIIVDPSLVEIDSEK